MTFKDYYYFTFFIDGKPLMLFDSGCKQHTVRYLRDYVNENEIGIKYYNKKFGNLRDYIKSLSDSAILKKIFWTLVINSNVGEIQIKLSKNRYSSSNIYIIKVIILFIILLF